MKYAFVFLAFVVALSNAEAKVCISNLVRADGGYTSDEYGSFYTNCDDGSAEVRTFFKNNRNLGRDEVTRQLSQQGLILAGAFYNGAILVHESDALATGMEYCVLSRSKKGFGVDAKTQLDCNDGAISVIAEDKIDSYLQNRGLEAYAGPTGTSRTVQTGRYLSAQVTVYKRRRTN